MLARALATSRWPHGHAKAARRHLRETVVGAMRSLLSTAIEPEETGLRIHPRRAFLAASIVTRVAARSPSTIVRASMRRMRDHLMRRNTRNRPSSAAPAALFAQFPAVIAVAVHHSLDPGFPEETS